MRISSKNLRWPRSSTRRHLEAGEAGKVAVFEAEILGMDMAGLKA